MIAQRECNQRCNLSVKPAVCAVSPRFTQRTLPLIQHQSLVINLVNCLLCMTHVIKLLPSNKQYFFLCGDFAKKKFALHIDQLSEHGLKTDQSKMTAAVNEDVIHFTEAKIELYEIIEVGKLLSPVKKLCIEF